MAEPIDFRIEQLKRDGAGYYEECLENALQVMVRVARGETSLQQLGEWVSLNYAEYRHMLPEQMRVLPPKRN